VYRRLCRHLAHNVNLSAKAICGLGAFAKLCDLRGDKAKAAEYQALAKQFAARWVKEADDGDHFRLAFDRPGTWSQKYILGLGPHPGLKPIPGRGAGKGHWRTTAGFKTLTACRWTTAKLTPSSTGSSGPRHA